MLARVIALLPLALLASAAHLQARQTSGQCNTGSATCCTPTTTNDLMNMAASVKNHALFEQLKSVDPTVTFGTNCSPTGISVGNNCVANQEPVCCSNNYVISLIGIVCSPVTIVL